MCSLPQPLGETPDSQIGSRVGALYADHHDWLVGWLRRKLQQDADASDLAHDTFVRILQRLHLGQPVREDTPRALLTHIAKGLLIDRWRRQEVEQAYLSAVAQLPQAQAPSAETTYLAIEMLCLVDRMLSTMPVQTRRIFLLAQLEGWTLQQIATELAMPVITVRRHLHKALLACMTLA